MLFSILPLSMFRFEGFTIITVRRYLFTGNREHQEYDRQPAGSRQLKAIKNSGMVSYALLPVSYLQERKILGPTIEYLELEELQGVSGLKAMRVEVLSD